MYQEIQKPRQWWVLLSVYGAAVLLWWGFVQQIMLGYSFGLIPVPDSVLIACWIAFGIALPLVWISMRMIVRVNGEALTIRYQPFLTRRIPIGEIAGYGVRTYDPLREYGGWGISIRLGGPRAYSVSGNGGVDVVLYNGERIMIGSQHPHDLAQALDARLG